MRKVQHILPQKYIIDDQLQEATMEYNNWKWLRREQIIVPKNELKLAPKFIRRMKG